MGRDSMIEKRGKLTREQLRDYLIDIMVDEKGRKVSTRTIFNDVEFMKLSGFYRNNKRGKMNPVSAGTMSYWIGELKITERHLYDYHTKVTNRINVTFENFTRKGNRNNVSTRLVDFDKHSTSDLIKMYNRMSKEYGFADYLHELFPRHRVLSAYETFILFMYGDNKAMFSREFKRMYIKLKKVGVIDGDKIEQHKA